MSEKRLERHFRGLENTTTRVLDDLGRWQAEDLSRSGAGGAWCALDVLEHLMMTESAVLRVMKQNLREGGKKIGIRDRLRSAVVLGIMLAPTRVRIPAQVKFLQPSGSQRDFGAMRVEWEAQRRRFGEFLRGLSATERSEGVFRHPVGGWTTATGALVFLRAHLHHHRYQLERIRKTKDSPLT